MSFKIGDIVKYTGSGPLFIGEIINITEKGYFDLRDVTYNIIIKNYMLRKQFEKEMAEIVAEGDKNG